MYIGKHSTPSAESRKDEEMPNIKVPQNYAGNAFSHKEEAPCGEEAAPTCQATEKHLPMCIEPPKEKGGFFAKADRLFSSDALLILLAILLSGSEDGGELAVILLLLLLF